MLLHLSVSSGDNRRHDACKLHASSQLTGASWKLILYSDGVVPGNVLAADNQRKSVVWYFSFLDFGWRLAYEEVWIPLAFARTAV
jgi:hypothetical protein